MIVVYISVMPQSPVITSQLPSDTNVIVIADLPPVPGIFEKLKTKFNGFVESTNFIDISGDSTGLKTSTNELLKLICDTSKFCFIYLFITMNVFK